MQTRVLGIEATLEETEFIWLNSGCDTTEARSLGLEGAGLESRVRDDDKLLASPGLHFLICQQE